jgi:hypothetical protein
MKRIILLLIVIICGLRLSAQLDAEYDQVPKFVESEYYLIDTFKHYSAGEIENDTIMYSQLVSKDKIKKKLDLYSINVPNNDTIYKRTNTYRLDFLRSGKIVAYRKINKYVLENVEEKEAFQMLDYLKKRKELNYNIDSFWEHAKVDSLINK